MNNDFFEALSTLETDNHIDAEVLIEKIQAGIIMAIKKDYPGSESINVTIDPEAGKFEMKILKEVVEGEPEDPANQITLDEALTISKRARVGGTVEIKLNSAKFGRVAAMAAKQSIRNDIKRIEKERLIAQYSDKAKECISATVEKVEPETLNAILVIDKNDPEKKNEIFLSRREQIPGEILRPGDIIKVYVVGVSEPDKRFAVRISRTHKDLVKRLFELEVPEIYDGTVEIKAISRVAGSRSKMAVWSNDPNVDAVGACIGPKRSRIQNVVNELKGEKIDIIGYSENDEEFIAMALAPAEVTKVEILDDDPDVKACRVTVPNRQLSLAIGNKGQNAKLANLLTGYKIDIVPEEPDLADMKPREEKAAPAEVTAEDEEE